MAKATAGTAVGIGLVTALPVFGAAGAARGSNSNRNRNCSWFYCRSSSWLF